jgi:hypothetical protein
MFGAQKWAWAGLRDEIKRWQSVAFVVAVGSFTQRGRPTGAATIRGRCRWDAAGENHEEQREIDCRRMRACETSARALTLIGFAALGAFGVRRAPLASA